MWPHSGRWPGRWQPYSGKRRFPQIRGIVVGTLASRGRYRAKGGAQLQRKDFLMRKLVLASAALLTLGLAAPAVQAQERTNLAPAAGATTGATLGFIFGGPIGAIVGGF